MSPWLVPITTLPATVLAVTFTDPPAPPPEAQPGTPPEPLPPSAEMLPRELADLLESFRAGELDVHLDVRRLDPIVNRLVYGVLSAALFMGSSRMLGAGVPPLIEGVSALGAGGLVLSLVLGLRLVRAIKHSGNLEEKKH